MRLALIADIHERVEFLRAALDRFRQEQVDRVIVLGDVFETGEQIVETCHLLAEAQAVGVWGNHDFGLCDNPSDKIRAKYPAAVTEYMTTLRPRLELDGCYFAHVEPWLDPEDIHDLWFVEGPPDSDGRLKQIFGAVPNRLMFAGHYHRWLLATTRWRHRMAGRMPGSAGRWPLLRSRRFAAGWPVRHVRHGNIRVGAV